MYVCLHDACMHVCVIRIYSLIIGCAGFVGERERMQERFNKESEIVCVCAREHELMMAMRWPRLVGSLQL